MSIMCRENRLLILCWLVFAQLTACGGGGTEGTPVQSVPALPPPPVFPPQPAGDIQFTLDNSIAFSQEVAAAGGDRLELDVTGGASFTIDIPQGAFFQQSTTVSMQSIVDTQGLPSGMTPIAAVSIAPFGAEFAVQPTLEIDLQALPKPVGSVAIFLANEDGTGLTYLLPLASDIVDAVLSDGPYLFRVPHFSVAGLAVFDPNGPGFPEQMFAETGEQIALRELNRRIENQAREILMGERVATGPIPDIELILAEWVSELSHRVNILADNATLEETASLAKEALRLAETRRALTDSTGELMLEDTELGAGIVEAFRRQILVWNDRCVASNTEAPARIRERLNFLRDLAAANLIGEITLSSVELPNFCVSTN